MASVADAYEELGYHRLIDWPARLAREWPRLEKWLAGAPSRRLLELGCATAEHGRWLVERGFTVLGVDRSVALLDEARGRGLPPGLELVEGDLLDLESVVAGPFGGALCLGNTLPHVTTDEELAGLLAALRRLLLPGGVLVLQLLGYDRILDGGLRALPVAVRPAADGEAVFVRLMTPWPDGRVSFFPTRLSLLPDRDPPVTVVASRRVELRGWRRDELVAALGVGGFWSVEERGGFDGSAWRPSSNDLILIAR